MHIAGYIYIQSCCNVGLCLRAIEVACMGTIVALQMNSMAILEDIQVATLIDTYTDMYHHVHSK